MFSVFYCFKNGEHGLFGGEGYLRKYGTFLKNCSSCVAEMYVVTCRYF
jgi:hypothetical protein